MTKVRSYNYADLAATYREWVGGGDGYPRNANYLTRLIEKWRGDYDMGNDESCFYGPVHAETMRMLDEGFACDPLPADSLPQGFEGYGDRLVWRDDEGEFDYDAYLEGEDECFSDRESTSQIAGINLVIRYSFQASKWGWLSEYGAWCGALVHALERRGHDLSIRLNYPQSGAYGGGERSEIDVILSRFGERTMMRDWSVMFSPAGWRQLYFLAIALPAEREGIAVSPGLGCGSQAERDFGLGWDADSRTLTVQCPFRPKPFDPAAMSRLLEGMRDEF
jgi:hypothetical protein